MNILEKSKLFQKGRIKMKAFKKLVSVILAGAIFMTSAMSAVFADEISTETSSPKIGELCENGLYFVGEKESVLEDGTIIIERSYTDTSTDEIRLLASSSGSKTLSHIKEIITRKNFVDTVIIILSLSAYFSWDKNSGSAAVDPLSISHGYSFTANAPSNSVATNHKVEYESNKGINFLGGRVYAYARYTLTAKTDTVLAHDYSIYIEINCDGVESYDADTDFE